MTKSNVILLLLVLPLLSYAQINIDFGKPSVQELQMTSYEKDPTANAVVLYEAGKASIEKNDRTGSPELLYEHTVRIKIFNSKAFDKATVEIPLQKSLETKSKEKFLKAEAISVNQDRTVGRLNASDIFIEEYNEQFDIAKFTVPNVKEGVVIDYTFKTSSPFFYNFNRWEFQSDIPKVYSEYYTSVPANYTYHVKLTGDLKLSDQKNDLRRDCFYFQGLGSADCSRSTYIMKDIPAFKEEEHMLSKRNYLSAIDYELETFKGFDGTVQRFTKTWKNTDDEIRHKEEIGRQARKDNQFKDILPAEISAMPNSLEKAKSIYYFLQNQMFWNGKYRIFTDVDVKKAYEEKSGSVADLNLILLNTLKAQDFDVNFMLLSTRNNGLPTKLYPVISDFNYLITKLNLGDTSYLLDITEKNNMFGLLPEKALNLYGRVMDFKNDSYWYDLKTSANSMQNFTVQIDISEDGQGGAKIREQNSGYLGLNKRKSFGDKSEDEYANTLEEHYDKDGKFKLVNYSMKDREDPEKMLSEIYELEFTEGFDNSNIILNPYLGHRYEKNPFTLENRTYPVDFAYPFSYRYNIIINLPDNYEIKELPPNQIVKLSNDQGSITHVAAIKGNVVTINLKLDMASPIFYAEEYDGLKRIFEELVLFQNKRPLLIQKKTSK